MTAIGHRSEKGTEDFLSALSKEAWRVNVLTEIAQRRSCERSDLHHLLSSRDPGYTGVNDEALDQYLASLCSARFISQASETIMITRHGAAAMARLSDAPVRTGPTIPESLAEGVRSPSRQSAGERDPSEVDRRREKFGSERSEKLRKIAAFVVIVPIVLISGFFVLSNLPQDGSEYRFATIERGPLAISTIATGRIEAIDAVEVSSQLSGQIVELYASFNDNVTAGAPLARLDDKTFEAAVAEAQARLEHAEASHASAVAATAGTNARYAEARRDLERERTLAEKGSASNREVDEARVKLATAESERDSAYADEAVQKAAIDMATAALRMAKINLERTVIRSPIDGIVIGRSVELGQTVATSMEATTLFTIAHDLTDMQVHARIDEADIGQIMVGQKASFSVDAYPDRAFKGHVLELHRSPEIVQNVVTYTVIVSAENPDLALFPGMTALVHITTLEQPNALLVPNAALRFEPEIGIAIPGKDDDTPSSGRPAHVWLLNSSGGLSPANVGVGVSDGSLTEVVSGSLKAGQAVAIGKQISRRENTLFGFGLGFGWRGN